ncbi:DUF1307 domain-containing protein [Vagococcus entomophilus]|uniref:DUF1307 domain-containing protein n=1 Tax=Vagococcus entomophilus TaxID=1160095 RepID=A0A430AGE4_9ENTE|nr:DUF1307 domain-containing protein [Vagococcus entomophilus]RSU06953.1 hypothetical protein CBF30_06750 [Vagococcus entomophilus]
MKKTLATGLGIMVICIGGLVGCSKEEKHKYSINTSSGMKTEMTFTVKGDQVEKQVGKSTIKEEELFKSQGVDLNSLTKEQKKIASEAVEKKMKDAVKNVQNIKGYSDKVTVKDGVVVETVTVDYSKASVKEIANKVSTFTADSSAKKSNKVSWKKTKKLLEKQNAKEIK